MTKPPSSHSAWGDVDHAPDPDWHVRFLDVSRRNLIARVEANPARELADLELAPGLRVLDAGCGTGDLTRLIAGQIRPNGTIDGIDFSQVMIDEARRRNPPGSSGVRFERADVVRLPFPNDRFDRSVATTLFQHLPDREAALRELIRVTRPGGRIVVTDHDYDTHVISTGDRPIDRKLVGAFARDIRHPFTGRELLALFRQFDLEDVRVTPQTIVVRGAGEQGFLPVLDALLPRFVELGRLTDDEANYTRTAISRRLQEGCYFESYTLFATNGRKVSAPPGPAEGARL